MEIRGGVLLFGGALLGEEMKASDGQGPILLDAADKKEVEGAFARIKAWQNGGYKENSSMKEDLAIVLAKGDWQDHVVPLCESILEEHLGLEFNETGLFNKLLSKNDNMLSYKDIRSDKKLCNFGSRTFFTTLLDKLEENEHRRNLYFKNNYDLKKIVEKCKSTTKSNKSRGMFGSKTNDKQAEALDKIEKIIDVSNMELKK